MEEGLLNDEDLLGGDDEARLQAERKREEEAEELKQATRRAKRRGSDSSSGSRDDEDGGKFSKEDLEGKPVSELKTIATEAGVERQKLDKALGGRNVEEAVIELILAASGSDLKDWRRVWAALKRLAQEARLHHDTFSTTIQPPYSLLNFSSSLSWPGHGPAAVRGQHCHSIAPHLALFNERQQRTAVCRRIRT